MKALVVRQPYAQLIAFGIKTIEVRSWTTKHRGPLAIVAGLQMHPRMPDAYRSRFDERCAKFLPRGRVLCIVYLEDVQPMAREHEASACVPWRRGLKAWEFSGVVLANGPDVKGRLGLFEVPL